jgi:hypothetical protein
MDEPTYLVSSIRFGVGCPWGGPRAIYLQPAGTEGCAFLALANTLSLLHPHQFSDAPGARISHAELLLKLQAALCAGIRGDATLPADRLAAALEHLGAAAQKDDAAYAPEPSLSLAVGVPVGEEPLSLLCRAFDVRFAHALIADEAAGAGVFAAVKGLKFSDAEARGFEDAAVGAWCLEAGARGATRAGVAMLKRELRESELCVFYRSGHFWVLYSFFPPPPAPGAPRAAPRLCLLVTAEAMATAGVAWQELTSDLDEDAFLGETFQPLAAFRGPPPPPPPPPPRAGASEEALRLQEEADYAAAIRASLEAPGGGGGGAAATPAQQPTYAALPRAAPAPAAAAAAAAGRNDWQARNNATLKSLAQERMAREAARGGGAAGAAKAQGPRSGAPQQGGGKKQATGDGCGVV